MRSTRSSLVAALLLCFVLCSLASSRLRAQHIPELNNGAKITVVGTLKLESRGNRYFLTVKPKYPCLANFDKSDQRNVSEIGIFLAGQSIPLRRYIGQDVSVIGVVQLEPVSPYYFNGTLIVATSLQLPDGSVLLPIVKAPAKTLPASVMQYYVLATFSPETASFSYKVWNSRGRHIADSRGYMSCGLNGAGNVMNCNCAEGYRPTGLGGMNGDWTCPHF